MREARIVLPTSIQNLPRVIAAAQFIHKSLDALAGGLTMFNGAGMWKGKEETIVVYDVAVDETDPEIDEKLLAIARRSGEIAGDECVYLRLPSGEVLFVNVEEGDEHIDTSDIPEAPKAFWNEARLVNPEDRRRRPAGPLEDHQNERGPVNRD